MNLFHNILETSSYDGFDSTKMVVLSSIPAAPKIATMANHYLSQLSQFLRR